MIAAPPSRQLLACVDVDYREREAMSACLLFERWEDDRAVGTLVARISSVTEYLPGQFYLRELPCLLAILRPIAAVLKIVVVDGYVWLENGKEPGLGARLYEALRGEVAVIGVAKTRFRGAVAIEVRRGQSGRPLYVTAAGVSAEAAARHVREMRGAHRVPTLLKQVDQLCRRT